ncbi:MAG TPA: AsmA family protein [Acidobacteriaceae bacterium]|nr:AsmA family protein [Acidobacteriaceae bacterium]
MGGEEKRPSPRRWILLAATLLVVAFVLPPLVNINRYKHRIADGIGRSIGRPVHISSVKLRLLPLPGFEFSDFSVEEDPQFGSEPILHSGSVVAYMRLLSLWRGRLEVSRIHFDDASLNLVREPNGGWNLASILVQAAHIPNAPTGQRYAGGTPRFPYIEAENARINFKQGNEKKPLSFLNSDLSISLAPGNDWEVHFKAQPVRTDLDLALADTGVLRIDGTLHRAALLGKMPLNLKVEWTGVPLGQLSRLILGRDIDWRGGLEVEARVDGTAELAQINATLKVAGLHRSEFSPARPMDVATSCQASFRKESRSLEDISCASPVGDGALLLTGSVQDGQTVPLANLTLGINRVPAAAVLAGLQEVRNGLGGGVQAAGAVNGHFHYTSQSERQPLISGEVGLASLSLTPPDASRPFLFAPVRLKCDSTEAGNAGSPALLLQPVRLSLGAPVPVIVDGRFTPAGFDLHFSGATSLARLQAFNKSFGLLGAHSSLLPSAGASSIALGGGGTAALDLDVRGKWLQPVPDSDNPIASSTAEGSIAIRNAELTTSYLSQPLRIASAQGVLNPMQIAWTNASISYGKLEAQGTLEYPTLCTGSVPCVAHFSLITPALDLGALQSTLLGSSEGGELLRELINRIDRHSVKWPDLSGTVQIGELSTGKLVVRDAVGAIDISGNSIRIRSLNGLVANGTMHLAGVVDASGSQPDYQLDAQITNAAPSALATIFEERWGSGVANLSAQLRMSGFDAQDLARSATGTLHWNWTKGGLAAEAPLPVTAQPFVHFDQWSADATIADSTIKITHSLLARGKDAIPLSGTISFGREIDLRGGSAADAVAITGTLEHPEVKTAREEVEN